MFTWGRKQIAVYHHLPLWSLLPFYLQLLSCFHLLNTCFDPPFKYLLPHFTYLLLNVCCHQICLAFEYSLRLNITAAATFLPALNISTLNIWILQSCSNFLACLKYFHSVPGWHLTQLGSVGPCQGGDEGEWGQIHNKKYTNAQYTNTQSADVKEGMRGSERTKKYTFDCQTFATRSALSYC